MVLDTNIEGEYTLLDVWNNEEVLGKVFDSNVESISFGEELVINDYALLPNYPNPFNPSTQISYQLPTNGFVSLKVYDIKGSEVKTLVSKAQPMGKYTVNFDASSLSSGVYFYKLTCGSFAKSMKMLLIK